MCCIIKRITNTHLTSFQINNMNDKQMETMITMCVETAIKKYTESSELKICSRLDSLESMFKGLLEINARLTQEIIHIKSNSSGSTSGFTGISGNTAVEKKTTGIIIKTQGNILKFSGNTYNHRAIFGENDGTWNKEEKLWEAPISKKEAIINTFIEKEIEHTFSN